MFRSTACTLAACASIAALTLLAPPASAQFRVHPPQQGAGATDADLDRIEHPDGLTDPRFGAAVAIHGGLAFIGIPGRKPGGGVAVFTATPTELIRTDTLQPSDPVRSRGQFGRLLAYRDGILVVGSKNAAYIFKRNSSGIWTQRQKLTAPAADEVSSFAHSLHYENGTLVVGVTTAREDAIYTYERNEVGKFVLRNKLSSPNSAVGGFGGSLSTAAGVLVAGASGAVYVFRRNSAGGWRYQQTLIANELGTQSDAARAGFGSSVAIDKGMILVGAPRVQGGSNDSGAPDGAVYGFVPVGADYAETLKLDPRGEGFTGRYAEFGRLLAMFNQRIVAGGPIEITSESELDGYAVFSYTRAGSSVLPRGSALGHFGGTSLALADERLLVGVPQNNDHGGGVAFYRLNVFE